MLNFNCATGIADGENAFALANGLRIGTSVRCGQFSPETLTSAMCRTLS